MPFTGPTKKGMFSQGAAAANVLFVILLIAGIFYIKLINEEEEIM